MGGTHVDPISHVVFHRGSSGGQNQGLYTRLSPKVNASVKKPKELR